MTMSVPISISSPDQQVTFYSHRIDLHGQSSFRLLPLVAKPQRIGEESDRLVNQWNQLTL